MPMANNVHN